MFSLITSLCYFAGLFEPVGPPGYPHVRGQFDDAMNVARSSVQASWIEAGKLLSWWGFDGGPLGTWISAHPKECRMASICVAFLIPGPWPSAFDDWLVQFQAEQIRQSTLRRQEKGVRLAGLLRPGMTANQVCAVFHGDNPIILSVGPVLEGSYTFPRYGVSVYFGLNGKMSDSSLAVAAKEPVYEGKTIKEWLRAIGDKEESIQYRAAMALSKVGSAAVAPLVEALDDKNADLRYGAAFTLGEIGPAARPAIGRLISALEDWHVGVRWTAADALGRIDPGAKAITGPLGRALKDRELVVRLAAAEALGHQGPGASTAVVALAAALKDEEEEIRAEAAKSLGEIGPRAKAAVGPLRDALRDQEQEVRKEAANALIKIDSKAAVATLTAAIRDPDAAVRVSAAARLASASPPHTDTAVLVLADALRDGNPDVRLDAAHSLGEIGPLAKAALPRLMDALKDEKPFVRRAAARALRKIDREAARQAGLP
jgi:HEAT repeat protein